MTKNMGAILGASFAVVFTITNNYFLSGTAERLARTRTWIEDLSFHLDVAVRKTEGR